MYNPSNFHCPYCNSLLSQLSYNKRILDCTSPFHSPIRFGFASNELTFFEDLKDIYLDYILFFFKNSVSLFYYTPRSNLHPYFPKPNLQLQHPNTNWETQNYQLNFDIILLSPSQIEKKIFNLIPFL